MCVVDYGFYKLEVKTKTATDIEFTTNANSNHDSGKFMGTLETKYKWKDYGKWSCKFSFVCHFIFAFFCIIVFNAVTLFDVRQAGYPACKKYCYIIVLGSPWQHCGSILSLSHYMVIVTGRMLRWSQSHRAMQPTQPSHRVATNLENLEYSGISLNMEKSGNSQGILCNLREKL